MPAPSKPSKKVPIPGSEKKALPGAKVLGKLNPHERIEITVLVRSKEPVQSRAEFHRMLASPPAERQYLTREQWAAQHGSDPADLAKVEQYAHEHGLSVVLSDAAQRRVVLSGTIEALTQAFSVRLQRISYQNERLRGRTGPISVPPGLVGIIEDVKGFDNRPQTQPHFHRRPGMMRWGRGFQPRAGGSARAFTPLEVGKLYRFPKGDGAGQTIAIIELGGGYRPADLTAYFQRLGVPLPVVSAVSVDGAVNAPGDDADGEVMLDIEVAAAIAPKAKIAVYFAPNTDQGFLDAIKTAVHDDLRKPTVISISWGSPEQGWTPQSLRNYDAVFQEAAALGVTITVAAGDHGSSDVTPVDKKKRVDFPSASPWVLSCGGTRLEADAAATTITRETVWNNGDGWAGGGGVSVTFPQPFWQKDANVPLPAAATGANAKKTKPQPGRGVPDVSGDADGDTGYQVRVDGKDQVIGGTSAVAPLWAGLVALLNQKLGKPVGFLNSLLYSGAAKASFRDITEGNNVGFAATPGWDACTGLGTPDGTKLLAALQPPTTGAKKK